MKFEHTKAICVFDLETTGPEPEDARIVTAFIGIMDTATGVMLERYNFLVDPGVEIPKGASDVHGITTEMAREKGADAKESVFGIMQRLDIFERQGIPLVIYNGRYDVTVLEREIRRHWPELHAANYRQPRIVLDPLVLDKAVDKYRKGSRKLVDAAATYGVPVLENAHDAEADCTMTGQLLLKIMRHPMLRDLELEELHAKQIEWAREQGDSFREYRKKQALKEAAGSEARAKLLADAEGVRSEWPLIPFDPDRIPTPTETEHQMTDKTETAPETAETSEPQVAKPQPPQAAGDAPLIHQQMLKVVADMPRLRKDGVGPQTQGKYPFLPIDNIVEAARPLFIRHGIMVYPRLLNRESRIDLATDAMTMGENPRTVTDGKVKSLRVREVVEYEFRFVCVVDGSEIVTSASGESMDTQDKASRKAATSAYKTLLIPLLSIVTGEEDPDANDPQAAVERAGEAAKKDRGEQQREAARAPRSSRTRAAKPAPDPSAEQAAAETGANTETGEVPDEAPQGSDAEASADAQKNSAQRSISTNPKAALGKDEAEPAQDVTHEETSLDKQKLRVRAANEILKLDKVKVDELATELTGIATRSEWIVKVNAVKKLADRLEEMVAEQQGGDA